jgi:hypothetical protein
LGEINDSQREQWIRAIEVFDEDAGVVETTAPDGVEVRLKDFELHRPLFVLAPTPYRKTKAGRRYYRQYYGPQVGSDASYRLARMPYRMWALPGCAG